MDIPVISYASAHGAKHGGTAHGPQAIQKLLNKIPHDLPLKWYPELSNQAHTQKLDSIPIIAQLCQYTAKQSYDAVIQQQRFLVLGGDHSCAIGSWSGAAVALQEHNRELGLIWIDAHMDSHTLITSPSHNVHGMPVAALLGFGDPRLTEVLSKKAKIKPENLVLIGVRSFEEGEAALLKDLNAKIYFMEEVKEVGILKVLHEAIVHVTRNTAGFGISIDLDALDPCNAPGVGSPVEDGINPDNFIESLKLIHDHEKFIGAEIAELNPEFDKDNKTAEIAVRMIQALYTS